MNFKFALVIISGRAMFGIVHTNVDIRKDDDDQLAIVSSSDEVVLEIFETDNVVENEVVVQDEIDFVVGNDLDQILQIYNKFCIDNYHEDMSEKLSILKQNLDQQMDI